MVDNAHGEEWKPPLTKCKRQNESGTPREGPVADGFAKFTICDLRGRLTFPATRQSQIRNHKSATGHRCLSGSRPMHGSLACFLVNLPGMALGLLFMFAAWAGCIPLCRKLLRKFCFVLDWRLTVISASCLWAALLVLIVEILSLMTALTKPALTVS